MSTNTGNKVVNTLIYWNVTQDAAAPGPITKPNVPGDPNYIPTGMDAISCPVDTTIAACPILRAVLLDADGIQWEFSVPKSVLANPAFDNLQVIVYKTSDTISTPVDTTVISDFTGDNYFTGSTTGLLPSENYSVAIRYRDSSNVQLHLCDPLDDIDTPAGSVGDTSITNTSPGMTITNVTGISGFTFGAPVAAGGSQNTPHTTGSGAVTITVTGAPFFSPSNIAITKNGVEVYHFTITGAGTHTSGSISYLDTDDLHVSVNTGA